jgi:hypothetical protein
LLAAACVSGPARAQAPDPSFLAGYWLKCEGGEQVSETWTDKRAGVMMGYSFTSKGDKASWEAARIGPNKAGVLTYHVQPSGQPYAEFPLAAAKSTATKLVFEDLAHDFPQRVIYERKGDRLIGRIEGTINGKPQAMEWTYTSAPLNKGCK